MCDSWSLCVQVYLRCSRGTAGHGGTTATAGTASRRPSRCNAEAVPSGTEGTAPGLGSGGPKGSMGPAGAIGGQQVELQCLKQQTPELTFSESL